MKKLLLFTACFLSLTALFAQGQKWATQGNSIGNGDYIGTNNNMPLLFYTNGHQQMVILQNGNVGIGTANPNYPLSVQGNALVNGTLFANNIAAASGMSIGSFKIVNGAVDSFNSATGTIFMNAVTINASNGITAQNITATQNLSGFLTNDSVKIRHIIPKDSEIVFGDPIYFQPQPAPASPAVWYYQYGVEFLGNHYPLSRYTNVGIGGIRAGTSLYIANTSGDQLTIHNDLTHNDVFNVDLNGNTYAAGKDGIKKIIMGTVSPTASNDYSINYLGFNLANNYNGNWTASYDGTNNGGTAIVTDAGGNLRFVSVPNHFYNATGDQIIPESVVIGNTSMIVSGVGVVVRPTATNSDGGVLLLDNTISLKKYDEPADFLSGNYIFGVAGAMKAMEVLVQPADWYDCVFKRDYTMLSIDQLAKYIETNKHLPDVPSSEQVQKNGIKLGEMDGTLLKKIEELTLYTIQLKKKIDSLSQEVTELKKAK